MHFICNFCTSKWWDFSLFAASTFFPQWSNGCRMRCHSEPWGKNEANLEMSAKDIWPFLSDTVGKGCRLFAIPFITTYVRNVSSLTLLIQGASKFHLRIYLRGREHRAKIQSIIGIGWSRILWYGNCKKMHYQNTYYAACVHIVH